MTSTESYNDTSTQARGAVAGVHSAPGLLNPEPSGRYNLIVIGGGAAGQACALGAAGLGARVALIEKAALGGNNLRSGSVPSRALVSVSRTIAEIRRITDFGINLRGGLDVDIAAVMRHVAGIRDQVSERHALNHLLEHGVDVFLGQGRFEAPGRIAVHDKSLRYSRAIIATGARPRIPEIPGLDQVPFLTSETIYTLEQLPRRLAVIGAGRAGCELAQVFARFGCEVTVFDVRTQCLFGEDADAAAIIQRKLAADGVTFRLGYTDLHFRNQSGELSVHSQVGNRGFVDPCDRVLIVAGRVARTGSLDLEKVGVVTDDVGIRVNSFLRTSNWQIFAAGDCCSSYRSTHAADALARVAIANSLFFGTDRTSALLIPSCIYTDPQVAHAGVEAAEAAAMHRSTLSVPLSDLDKSLIDGGTEGLLKLHHDHHGFIKGATLVCRNASELIGELVIAMNHNLRLGALASDVHPYPTESEILKHAGDLYRRTLVTPAVGRLLKKLLKMAPLTGRSFRKIRTAFPGSGKAVLLRRPKTTYLFTVGRDRELREQAENLHGLIVNMVQLRDAAGLHRRFDAGIARGNPAQNRGSRSRADLRRRRAVHVRGNRVHRGLDVGVDKTCHRRHRHAGAAHEQRGRHQGRKQNHYDGFHAVSFLLFTFSGTHGLGGQLSINNRRFCSVATYSDPNRIIGLNRSGGPKFNRFSVKKQAFLLLDVQ